MNYYKMRVMIAEDAKAFLAKLPDASFTEFCQNTAKKYGVTKKTIESVLEESYGVRFEEGQLVRTIG